MRQYADMPTLEFTNMTMLEIVDMPTPEFADMTVVANERKPVYQEWGFWILLAVSIVISFASGILIRGESLFG